MFGYRVGFSETADLMALFSIRINSILDNFEWPYLRNSSRSHLCDSTAFLFTYEVLCTARSKDVFPSVRPSLAIRYNVEAVKRIVEILTLSDSGINLNAVTEFQLDYSK